MTNKLDTNKKTIEGPLAQKLLIHELLEETLQSNNITLFDVLKLLKNINEKLNSIENILNEIKNKNISKKILND